MATLLPDQPIEPGDMLARGVDGLVEVKLFEGVSGRRFWRIYINSKRPPNLQGITFASIQEVDWKDASPRMIQRAAFKAAAQRAEIDTGYSSVEAVEAMSVATKLYNEISAALLKLS